MNIFCAIPEVLAVSIISEWLLVGDVCRLDSALTCNLNNIRDYFHSHILSSPITVLELPVKLYGRNKYLDWAIARKVYLNTIQLNETNNDQQISTWLHFRASQTDLNFFNKVKKLRLEGLNLSADWVDFVSICKLFHNLKYLHLQISRQAILTTHEQIQFSLPVLEELYIKYTTQPKNIPQEQHCGVSFLCSLIEDCSRLKSVSIRINESMEHFLLKLVKQNKSSLTSLDLRDCSKIRDECLLPVFSQCSQLKRLMIKNCELLNLTAVSFEKLQLLEVFETNICKPLSCIRSVLAHCARLTTLSVQFMESLISDIEVKCVHLTSLSMKYSHIVDSDLLHLMHYCPKLTYIDLEMCELLTESSLVLLLQSHGRRLTYLNVEGCNVNSFDLLSTVLNLPNAQYASTLFVNIQVLTTSVTFECLNGCHLTVYVHTPSVDQLTADCPADSVVMTPLLHGDSNTRTNEEATVHESIVSLLCSDCSQLQKMHLKCALLPRVMHTLLNRVEAKHSTVHFISGHGEDVLLVDDAKQHQSIKRESLFLLCKNEWLGKGKGENMFLTVAALLVMVLATVLI